MRHRKWNILLATVACTIAGGEGFAAGLGESATTVRVSVASDETQRLYGAELGSVSSDGRVILLGSDAAFVPSDTNGQFDVYLRIRPLGVTWRVSLTTEEGQLNGRSAPAAVSTDGRFVVFDSEATNLPRGDSPETNVYLRNRVDGTTRRVDVPPPGVEPGHASYGVDVSADGRFVTWRASDSNSEFLARHDVVAGTTTLIAEAATYTDPCCVGGGRMAMNGHLVFFSMNAKLFIWKDGVRHRIPVPSSASGASLQANDLSADGRYLLFTALRASGVEVYRYDRHAATTVRVSVGPAPFSGDEAFGNSISDDGRYVAFQSTSTAYAPGDTDSHNDVFVRDMGEGGTVRVSRRADGSAIDDDAFAFGVPSLSADGRVAIFETPGAAVPADTNGHFDVFLRGPLHP